MRTVIFGGISTTALTSAHSLSVYKQVQSVLHRSGRNDFTGIEMTALAIAFRPCAMMTFVVDSGSLLSICSSRPLAHGSMFAVASSRSGSLGPQDRSHEGNASASAKADGISTGGHFGLKSVFEPFKSFRRFAYSQGELLVGIIAVAGCRIGRCLGKSPVNRNGS